VFVSLPKSTFPDMRQYPPLVVLLPPAVGSAPFPALAASSKQQRADVVQQPLGIPKKKDERGEELLDHGRGRDLIGDGPERQALLGWLLVGPRREVEARWRVGGWRGE
jgi:hypothetical protein